MRIGKALVEALTIIASELVATAVFVVAAAPWLFPRDVKAVGLAAALSLPTLPLPVPLRGPTIPSQHLWQQRIKISA